MTIATKYYPGLIGLAIVVADRSGPLRRYAQNVLDSSPQAKTIVQFTPRRDLLRYFDVSVIPEELGGHYKPGDSSDFCETVLRFWYTMTAVILQDGERSTASTSSTYHSTGSRDMGRPLWLLPAGMCSNPAYLALERKYVVGRGVQRHSHRQGSFAGSTTGSGKRERNSSILDSTTDDGLCSVISEGEIDVDEYSDNGGGEDSGEASPLQVSGTREELAVQLQRETQRRILLEAELAKVQLGVSIDDAMATKLEASLRQIHNDLNNMVSEVIVKAKLLCGGADPSLRQLVEVADSLLVHVTQEKQIVPAMKLAAPMDRAPSGGVCCFM